MKRIIHDWRVETCDDPKINDELETADFYANEVKSMSSVRRAIAKRLGVSSDAVELVKNDNLTEEADEDGYGVDVFDVLVSGRIRETVWVEDNYAK